MSSKKHGRGNRRGSSRTAKGKLRRFHSIENVIIEEPFTLYKPSGGGSEEDGKAGDACYVSATVQNRRFYGLLVDQEALKRASVLWFQDEAGSLDLNRRMKMLCSQQSASKDEGKAEEPSSAPDDTDGDKKRPAAEVGPGAEAYAKRIKLEDGTTAVVPEQIKSTMEVEQAAKSGDPHKRPVTQASHHRQVQKFRYELPADKDNPKDLGLRYLLATYADIEAASEGDTEKAKLIDEACQAGGGFVGKFYYQYEVMRNALQTAISIPDQQIDDSMRTSMGFESFLHGTQLPQWFPLSNLQIGQHKVLSLLNMKRDNTGRAVWDLDAEASSSVLQGTHVPMSPRNVYRVGIMGGGISGLSCALELLRLCRNENIDVQVVLLEGRPRLGGRLLTDRETFKRSDGSTPFPVDLGAGWIHGIDHNPMASLAREAGISFVTASEEVKMLHSGQKQVDKDVDEKMGKLFDDLLDLGADDCWGANDRFERGSRNQLAVRWYSANLRDDSGSQTEFKRYPLSSGTGGATSEALGLERTDAPSHRHSSDVSIDHAVGKAIAKHKLRDFAQLSKEEHCVLHWQKSNVEFALGANVSDLSMKFWDSDERHAFEGDHVLLKEGYSTVVDYLVKQLEEFGDDKFQYLTDFPIGKIEYARRSTTLKYPDRERRKLVELSDACAVTTEDGSKTLKFDFVVCTLPLGVLKHYVSKLDQPPRVNENADDSNIAEKGVLFDPPLPLSKQDAIQTVGFGLLDKLYLQFPSPFWREPLGLEGEKYLFGNASGVHQHHYMFTDVGLVLGDVNDAPPILMTLISGKDAVKCETLTQDEIVKEVMETLQELLSPIQVPEPVAVRRTKWGMDKFSRGCYTFLPPGATDQDFQMLQSPVNGNGDSLVLEGSETMRMFFAGEHTTSLHPSMSHGALLSGIRAAKEVISTMSFSFNNDKTGDRLIPVALFRRDNPDTELECSMCHEFGSRVREGSLLAFKRGARQVLVHNNCAEFSPEVEVYEGQWSNVIRASNRGRSLNCTLCGKNGATIGCTHKDCFRLYHFSCSEDTGWRFDRDGKVFYCDLHRKTAKADEADKVSLKYYQTKTPYAVFRCFLCGGEDKAAKAGKLLAFQRRNRRILVHEKCARYTTVVDVKEDNESRTGVEFGNIFEAIEKAGICAECGRHGATIRCASCDLCYHYPCALEVGWKNRNRGLPFRCKHHRTENGNDKNAGVFQHALFSTPSAAVSSKATTAPSNSAVGSSPLKTKGSQDGEEIYISDSSDESSVEDASDVASKSLKEDIPLTVKSMAAEVGKILVSNNIQLQRRTLEDPWNIGLIATKDPDADKYLLSVDTKKNSAKDNEDFKHGELVRSINGMTIGTGKLGTFKAVLCVIAKELDILIEILRESDKKAEDETTQSVQTDLNIKVEAVKTKTVPGAGGKEATPAAGFAGTDAAPIDRSESDKKLSEKGSDSAKESVSAEEQQEPHRGQEKRQPSADIEMKDATMGEAIINSTTPNK